MDRELLYGILKGRPGTEISASGNPITMAETSEGEPLKNLKLYGWSKQETATGAQLFPTITPSTEVKSGITVEYMEHGKIHISGTAEKTVDFMTPTFELLSGTYTLSMGVNIDNALMRCTLSSAEGLPYFDILDNGASKTETTEGNMELYLLLRVYGGKTIDLTIQPMLNTGTSSLPWEPYTGGQPSPSPDYPQEIISAGMKWSTGKNLFDISKVEIGKATSWGATSGTAITVANSKVSCITIVDVSPNTIYTIKNYTPEKIWLSRVIETDADGIGYVNHRHYNNIEQALIQETITTSVNTTKLYIGMQTVDGAEITADTLNDVRIMIVQNSTIGDYEPYDGGVSKLYGDKIEVVARGKNLFTGFVFGGTNPKVESGIVTTKEGASYIRSDYIPCDAGKHYVYNIPDGWRSSQTIFAGSDKKYMGVLGANNTTSFGVPEEAMYFVFQIAKSDTTPIYQADLDVVNTLVQVEQSTVCTEYEPYHEPQYLSISTPTGLPAIPVDSGGNYTDANGQQWIADYVDWENKKYHKRVVKVDLGSLTYTNNGTASDGSIQWKSKEEISKKEGSYACMCPVFVERRASGTIVPITNGICDLRDDCSISLGYIGATNAEAFTKVMQGVMLYYELAEPIERDLTTEEIQAYKNLVTYAGTTIVENDAECYMEVSAGGGDTLRAKKLALLFGE